MFRVIVLLDKPFRHRSEWRDPRHAPLLASLCVLLVLLAACGSNGDTPDDRSFANNPAKQNELPTATLAATATQTPTPTPTPAPSPAALLHPRGAPSRFYVAVGGRLLTLNDQGQAKQVNLPTGATLLGFDWSPNGDQVAVAVGRPAKKRGETAVSLQVLDQDGKTQRTISDVVTLPARSATSAAGASAASRVLVDWGLVGNQLAVATEEGMLVVVPESGKPTRIAVELHGQTVRSMRISPRGDTVALLVMDGKQRGTVEIVSLNGTAPQPPKPLAGYGVDTRRSATAFAWVPDGQRLLFTQADAAGDPTTGGELYVMDTRTKERRLLDTGGRAGPAAGVTAFVPSPDGKTVAYVIGIDEGQGWVANSLWVRSLRDSTQVGVPIGTAENIEGPWWTSSGLVWSEREVDTADGSYQFVFYQQPPEGNVRELARVTVKRGAATPVATPHASPVASRPASPIATPATTDATPAARHR